MLKNKALYLVGGGMALAGLVAGIATTIVSAQSSTTTKPPAVVATLQSSVASVVDTPESANDPVDSDTGIKTNTSTSPSSVKEANDSDGGAASEASEAPSASDASEQ